MKIKTKYSKILLGLFALSVLFLWVTAFRYDTRQVELAGQKLTLEVAKSPKQWHRGLGQRENIGEHDGMIFVYPYYSSGGIVMRDMNFDIDIVWLADGEVVDIAPNVKAEPGVPEGELTVYTSRKKANVILELPAGWVDEHNLAIGDRIDVLGND